MIEMFPIKEVVAPYTVSPNDLGLTLHVMTAGDVNFPSLLNAINQRFSIAIVNQSAGAVVLKSQGLLIKPNGQGPAVAAVTLPASATGLMAGIPGSLEWLCLNLNSNAVVPAPVGAPVSAPVSAPVGGSSSVLFWGPGAGETLNGGAWNANPTLALGAVVPFVAKITNPLGIAIIASITEVYQGVSAFTNFGSISVPGSSVATLTGSITVAGTIGNPGFIRLILTDPYGSAQRADMPFVIGPSGAPVATPVGAPVSAPVSGK